MDKGKSNKVLQERRQ